MRRFLAAPISYEMVRTTYMRLDRFDRETVNVLLSGMAREVRGLVEPAAHGAALTERRVAYMRYIGQGHEIAAVYTAWGRVDDEELRVLDRVVPALVRTDGAVLAGRHRAVRLVHDMAGPCRAVGLWC